MILNWTATALKLLVGILTGSLSIVADGLDTFFDGFSNIIGLVGIQIAARPPDREHPYGHRKFETLAAIGIAFLLFLTAWELFKGALDRLLHPLTPNLNLWNGLALLLSIAAQTVTTIYEHRRGFELNSEVLVADARHTQANIYISLSVLAGQVIIQAGYPQVDALLAVSIALVIAKIGLDILRDSSHILVDRMVIDPAEVEAIVLKTPGVVSCHRVRSRGAIDHAALDLHIHVSARLSVDQGAAIANEVRQRLLTNLRGVQDVTVHVKPTHTDVNSARVHIETESPLNFE